MPLNRFIDHVLGNPTHTPAVIFGAGNKLRPDGPYLDLYQEFRGALQQARRVVIIGYSFSDEHVNELLRRWVTSSRSYRVMRVSLFEPGARMPVAEGWSVGQRHAHLQVVTGAAAAVMDDLLRDDPELLK